MLTKEELLSRAIDFYDRIEEESQESFTDDEIKDILLEERLLLAPDHCSRPHADF